MRVVQSNTFVAINSTKFGAQSKYSDEEITKAENTILQSEATNRDSLDLQALARLRQKAIRFLNEQNSGQQESKGIDGQNRKIW